MGIETKFWNDFGSGWSPNDDAINGKGLLQMSNLELDRNGALSLVFGTTVKSTFGDSPATGIYSRFLQGIRHEYSSLTSGKVFRDTTQLTAIGSTTRTGFATAFDSTLITSGGYRVKDSGTTTANLGIGSATLAPTITPLVYKTTPMCTTATEVNQFHGTAANGSSVGSYFFINNWQVNGTDFSFVFATYDSAVVTNTTVLTQTTVGTTTTPFDPNDIFNFSVYSIDGSGNPNSAGLDMSLITQIQIAIYLVAPASLTPTIEYSTDYFIYTWTNNLGVNGDDIRTVTPSKIAFAIRRQQFQRIGGNTALDWSHCVGYAFAVQCVGAMPSLAGVSVPQVFQGGHAGLLTGDIQYAQMNVAKTSSYTAKSTLGPIATMRGSLDQGAAILAQVPIDGQVTHVWIFRRQGGLAEWYRVLEIPIASIATNTIDTFNNSDAEILDITVDLNLVSAASTGITEDILEIIGPIEGRWYYFTKSFIYPSDINDPDLANVSEGVRICGSQSEVFMWARKIDEALVLVGTSIDIYELTGTFKTLPDGTIDIFYRPLGSKVPPIAINAVEFSGIVIYLSDSGWMSISPNGANQSYVDPATSLLYRNETRYGYLGISLPGNAPGSVQYPITIHKSKLWCFITGTGRIEVYDFIRKYWYPIEYGLGDASGVCETQDGQLIAYYARDNKLRVIDDQTTKLVDGVTNQTVKLLSVAQDGGQPRNRKDLSTFKSRVFTNGSNLSVSIITDQGTFALGTVSSLALNAEVFKDISNILETCKWWQFSLTGSFSNFLIQDCSVDFDLRPTPVTFIRGRNNNFGSGSKKRLRVWPFIIDTRGNPITLTPIVDNILGTPVQITTLEKTTFLQQFITDVFGIDYGYTLFDPLGLMEFYNDMPPEIVQTLPIAKRFDQIGPVEFFRYGKVQKLDIRILTYGTELPYRLYISDTEFVEGVINTLNGQEGSYTIGLPKGTSGSIFRVEFGPTAFDFHRFYTRVLVNKSGINTDGSWLQIG